MLSLGLTSTPSSGVGAATTRVAIARARVVVNFMLIKMRCVSKSHFLLL